MKLRNKKTGEIIDLDVADIKAQFGGISVIPLPIKLNGDEYVYTSLASLNEDWEDYEEPMHYWYISARGQVLYASRENDWEKEKAIGNIFETKEEAEKAVEKLKAWKRLKDKGFRFEGWEDDYPIIGKNSIFFNIPEEDWETDVADDLNLLFGE